MSAITGYNPATVSTALTSGTYRHVALSISGTVHTLYLDGSMVAQNLSGGNVFASYTSAIPNVYIGCASDLSYGLTGSIDDFKIWNRVLPPTDISAIYYANLYNITLTAHVYLPLISNTLNISTNTTTVSPNGSITFPTIGGKQAAYFINTANPGNNTTNPNYLTFPFTYSSTFTFSYWVYGVPPLAGDHTACVIANSSLTDLVLSDYYVSGFTTAAVYVALNSSAAWTNTPDLSIPSSQWNHIAYTINGNVLKFYINGSLSRTVTGNRNMPNNAGSVVLLGKSISRGFKGYIRQFLFYTSSLTDSEIQAVYNATI
jgi:hypothetical protein